MQVILQVELLLITKKLLFVVTLASPDMLQLDKIIQSMENNSLCNFWLLLVLQLQIVKTQLGLTDAHNVKQDSLILKSMDLLDSISAFQFQKFIKNVGPMIKNNKDAPFVKKELT